MFAKDYRRLARKNLQSSWMLSVGVAMIACLLGGLIVGHIFWPVIEPKVEYYILTDQDPITYAVTHPGEVIRTFRLSWVLNLVTLILGGVIQLGYAQYLLNQHDHRGIQFNDLFSNFDRFGAGFCQAFLRNLYVYLWGLLFIIPGIIAGYRYAMTPFIMAEHPQLTASEAIRASKQMMRGNKWALFCLDFSFFGWILLCALSLNIGNLWLNPYRNAAYAAFYRNISQKDSNNSDK